MESTVSMFEKNESPRSPTRLQRQAPTALHLDRVFENPFLQQSCDSVASEAIPLLSPLFVSPNPHSSLSKEGYIFTSPVNITEKNGSQPSMDQKEGWEYSDSDQMSLLNMFHTKFVLLDSPQ